MACLFRSWLQITRHDADVMPLFSIFASEAAARASDDDGAKSRPGTPVACVRPRMMPIGLALPAAGRELIFATARLLNNVGRTSSPLNAFDRVESRRAPIHARCLQRSAAIAGGGSS